MLTLKHTMEKMNLIKLFISSIYDTILKSWGSQERERAKLKPGMLRALKENGAGERIKW